MTSLSPSVCAQTEPYLGEVVQTLVHPLDSAQRRHQLLLSTPQQMLQFLHFATVDTLCAKLCDVGEGERVNLKTSLVH